jgi:hypothetical protein
MRNRHTLVTCSDWWLSTTNGRLYRISAGAEAITGRAPWKKYGGLKIWKVH